MTALSIDKGWLAGPKGSFIQLNAITGVRVGRSNDTGPEFDVDALVQGHWITIATFDDERAAKERVSDLLKELKLLFRYGH